MLILFIAGAIASLILLRFIVEPNPANKEEDCTSEEQARRFGLQILQNDVQEISRDRAEEERCALQDEIDREPGIFTARLNGVLTGYRADFEIVESIDRGTVIRFHSTPARTISVPNSAFPYGSATPGYLVNCGQIESSPSQKLFFKSNCKYFNQNPYLKCAVGTGCEGCKDFEER